MAAMPPFTHQALLRAEARTQEAAQAFLQAACELAAPLLVGTSITLYAPVPMPMQRVANVERAQMLLEATNRSALLRFLSAWQQYLHWLRGLPEHRPLVRWLVDVDPLSI